jgi:hypothetical protein
MDARPVSKRPADPRSEWILADDAPVAREVVDGEVRCPLRGPVDVLTCFVCPASRWLTSGHEERLLCVAGRSAS